MDVCEIDKTIFVIKTNHFTYRTLKKVQKESMRDITSLHKG